MSSRSLTGEAAESGASIPWRFLVFWPLSFAVPVLLLTMLRIAIFSVSQDDLAYMAALLLSIAGWLLVAYLQFRLIRPYLPRTYLWLIATFIGGNLGSFAGGLAQLKTMSMLEMYANEKVLISDYDSVIHSDWIFAAAPTVSIMADVLVAAMVLGFLQSLCLAIPLSVRLLWLLASGVSGIAAGAFGYGCYMGSIWAMLTIYPVAMFRADIVPQLLAMAVGVICGTILYGFLTGVVLRRILIRGARQAQALVGQFE